MIHPTSVIETGAVLGQNVKVGPFCYIAANVVIGDNTVLESHVVLKGPTVIGKGNHFYQFTSIGEDCQDKNTTASQRNLLLVTTMYSVKIALCIVALFRTKGSPV